MTKGLIYQCYIRARVHGKWGSHSIGELFDRGEMTQINLWFFDKVLGCVGLTEGQKAEKENLELGIAILQSLHAVVLINPDKDDYPGN